MSHYIIPVALIWIYSCASLQRPIVHPHTIGHEPTPPHTVASTDAARLPDLPAPAPLFDATDSAPIFQSGIASWYGEDFHGKTTSNGEIYDMHKLTAAHPTLPFNTIIEVENSENQKKVLVRINDRGPFLKNRIIDLSYKAAQRIDMADAGTAQVNLRVIKPQAGAPATKTVHNYYFLQLGAFSQQKNAQSLIEQLKGVLPELHFDMLQEKELYKIVSEKSIALEKIQELKDRLTALKIPCFLKQTTD